MIQFDRRAFLRTASFASAALFAGTEAQLAYAQRRKTMPAGVNPVFLNANENPLGPCEAARAAMMAAVAESGRYHDEYAEALIKLFTEQNGLKPEYVDAYSGSSQPLAYTVLAFCNAQRPVVMANPGYEAAARVADVVGASVLQVPLAKDYAHDVKAMAAASTSAGVIYVASPNNPTGTVTSRADIEWLLANKPKGSIVLLDEAYIHFSDATPCLDLAAADKDIVVLRTFSKLYGMAGARLGLAVARPDLLKKLRQQGGWTMCPVTATQAGIASLQDTSIVSVRKKINAEARQETFDWLTSKGIEFVPSQANHFMVEVKRPGAQVIDALATQGVLIGRLWPSWPTHVRITVGTREEMAKLRTAFEQVLQQSQSASFHPVRHSRAAQFS